MHRLLSIKPVWLLPLLAALVVHVPVLMCPFVYDDVLLVAENSALSSGSYVTDLWIRDYGLEFTGQEQGYYRPIFMLIVFTAHKLFGASPLAFHMLSLILFCTAVSVFGRMAGKMFIGRPGAALFATMLYAVHPARVETVSLVMSMPDLLVEMAAMFTVMIYLSGRMPWGWKCLALLLLGISASLTKESAFFIITAIAGTALMYAFIERTKASVFFAASALIQMAGVFGGYLIRQAAGVGVSFSVNDAIRLLFNDGAASSLKAFLFAVYGMVVPDMPVIWCQYSCVGGVVWSLMLTVFLALPVIVWIVMLSKRDLSGAMLFGWIIGSLFSLSILLGIGLPYSQRYIAAAPLIILITAAGATVFRRVQSRTVLTALSVAYITMHAGYSLSGSFVYMSKISFASMMYESNPKSIIPLGAIAMEINKGGRVEDVERVVREATQIDAMHPQVQALHNMLIKRYIDDRRYVDAVRICEWSLGIYNNDWDKMVLESVAVANMGRLDKAVEIMEKVHAGQPDNKQYSEMLARYKKDLTDSAIKPAPR